MMSSKSISFKIFILSEKSMIAVANWAVEYGNKLPTRSEAQRNDETSKNDIWDPLCLSKSPPSLIYLFKYFQV